MRYYFNPILRFKAGEDPESFLFSPGEDEEGVGFQPLAANAANEDLKRWAGVPGDSVEVEGDWFDKEVFCNVKVQGISR